MKGCVRGCWGCRAIHNMANYCSLVKFNKDQTFYPDEGATINVIVDGSASVCTPPSTDHETVKVLACLCWGEQKRNYCIQHSK